MTSPTANHGLRSRRRATQALATAALLLLGTGWAYASPVPTPAPEKPSTPLVDQTSKATGAPHAAATASEDSAGEPLPIIPGLLTTTTTTTTPQGSQPSQPSGAPGPVVIITKSCGCSAGVWALNAVAHTTSGTGRIWLTVNGRRAGEWTLGTATSSVTALAYVPDGASVGVSSVPTPGGSTASVIVDGFSVADAPEGFTTVGRDMLDLAGVKYRMYGVVKSGFEYHQYGGEVGDQDAAGIQSWGGTAVRLLASAHLWSSRSCWYSSGYADRLAAEVATLNARGQYVIINQYGSMAGNSCGVAANREMADDLAIDFWREVAGRFKGNPLVGFDLYNEPHDVTTSVWRDGGMVAGFHTPGMQAMYDTVRAAGATNLVFVSGPSWANDLRVTATAPLDGYGIVYAGHVYCFDCPGNRPQVADDWMTGAAATHPVVMTEFGDIANDGGEFNKRVIEWANAHDIGWLAYSWSHWESRNPWALLAPQSYEPTTNGRPVYYALRYNAGQR